MPETDRIPEKSFYRISEVCQHTDTQPYVLSFWESEFPQLNPRKSSGGQSIYRKAEIDLVLRIKQLLYQEEYTIAAARKRLDEEGKSKSRSASSAAKAKGRSAGRKASAVPVTAQPERPQPAPAQPAPAARPIAPAPDERQLAFDRVSRERYEDAVDEIAHLRLQLKEAETRLRRAESSVEQAQRSSAEQRERSQLAIGRLERLLEILS